MALFAKSVQRWDQPHDGMPVTADDRERIITNVRRAFDWHGSNLRVIEPPSPPEQAAQTPESG